MTALDRSWAENFIWHIRQVPFQLLHMRQLAENTVAAQDTRTGRITGTSEKARLPLRVDPADDADNLWAVLVITSQHIAEHVGGASPRPLRARMWQGSTEPQGLPVCTPQDAFAMAAEVVRWLEACTPTIERAGELHDAVDHLNTTIRKARARYPRSEPTFKAYRPRICTCQSAIGSTERTIYITRINGGLGARCEACGQTWTR